MISTDQNSDEGHHWNRFLLSGYNCTERFYVMSDRPFSEFLRHVLELRRSIISTACNSVLQPAISFGPEAIDRKDIHAAARLTSAGKSLRW